MPQFDIHRNIGRFRENTPYLIVLQNARFDQGSTRLVAGLTLRVSLDLLREYHAAPEFIIEGMRVVLNLLNMASVSAARLGPVVAGLPDEISRMKIQRALDEFLSQA